jgi:hypothetical protein
MKIGIDAWIIQDGNYGDFEVSQRARFALEFYSNSIASMDISVPNLTPTRPGHYNLTGLVVYRTDKVWVIDAGLFAYSKSKPPEFATVGSCVTGDFYLGVDPFFYFEDLCYLPGMPELRYEWHVEAIQLETTPWISTRDAGGQEIRQRDETQISYKDVQRTDAWRDDNGLAHYVLECTRIEGA